MKAPNAPSLLASSARIQNNVKVFLGSLKRLTSTRMSRCILAKSRFLISYCARKRRIVPKPRDFLKICFRVGKARREKCMESLDMVSCEYWA